MTIRHPELTGQVLAEILVQLEAERDERAEAIANAPPGEPADELAHAVQTPPEEILADLHAAIVRIDAGTYGLCELCEQPISVARLEALPATTRCITCAAQPTRGLLG